MSSMDTLQFRDFIFKHNPERISVSNTERIVTHICPGASDVTQRLGKKPRTVTCTGSFFGDSFQEAMGQLLRFRQKGEGDAGILYVPGHPPFFARLLELSFDATGDGRIIPYTIRFIEVESA